MKDWVIKYRNYILFIITIIISCILYWNYLIGHFAAETYAISLGYKNYAINAYLADGRFFSFLFIILADKLEIPILTLISISTLSAIIIATVAILYLKNYIIQLVKLTKKQELIVWGICYCIIFNFMMVEIMYFPECCIMVSSILCYIISAKYLIQRKYVRSLFILIIGIFCYQGTIGFFIVCAFVFSVFKNGKIGKAVFIDICKMTLMGIIVASINLVFIKLIALFLHLVQNKAFSLNFNTIKQNIYLNIKSVYPVLQNNCGLFPKNLLLIYIEIVIGFTLLISYKEKEDKVMKLLALILVTIVSSFIMFIIQRGSIFTGRVHFCIGSLIGISLLYIYCMTNIKDKKIWRNIFLVILLSYAILNCVNTAKLTTEHKIANKLEKEECIRIENLIYQYENESGIQINKVVPILIQNQLERGYFEQTKRRTIITYNNIRHYYGYSGVLQYYLKRDFEYIGLNKESENIYRKYIIENNLEYGNIVCIEDTLYCPQYHM